jgi:hypothetical protein
MRCLWIGRYTPGVPAPRVPALQDGAACPGANALTLQSGADDCAHGCEQSVSFGGRLQPCLGTVVVAQVLPADCGAAIGLFEEVFGTTRAPGPVTRTSCVLPAICQKRCVATPHAAPRGLGSGGFLTWPDVVRRGVPHRCTWGPRCVHTAEVVGSNPTTPTSRRWGFRFTRHCAGLGIWPVPGCSTSGRWRSPRRPSARPRGRGQMAQRPRLGAAGPRGSGGCQGPGRAGAGDQRRRPLALTTRPWPRYVTTSAACCRP